MSTGVDAEILAIGSELLTPTKIDTNSLWLTDHLNALGVEVVQKSVVGDDRDRLTQVLKAAMGRVRLVFVTGGLGPTEDDVTRDAAAAAVGRTQYFSQEICDGIEARFRRMGRRMVENNKRQAYVIEGAEVLPNDRGTAAGQWIAGGGASLILLPGPPRELKAMFELECLPRLRRILPEAVIVSRCYRISCMPESDLDQLIAPVYTQYTNPATTVLAGPGDIQVYLRARSARQEEAQHLVDEVGREIEALLGDRCYTRSGATLEQTLAEMLTTDKATLAVAESGTGGMLSERITSVPGSSAFFRGGFLTYTEDAKHLSLGVDRNLLDIHGAVSQPVAAAMAEGARGNLSSTWAVSITGYAGPDGGTAENPAGTVFIGVAGPDGTEVRRLQFVGDRQRVRQMATVWALDLLRLRVRRLQPAAA